MALVIVSLVHTVAMFNMWKLVRINQIARQITDTWNVSCSNWQRNGNISLHMPVANREQSFNLWTLAEMFSKYISQTWLKLEKIFQNLYLWNKNAYAILYSLPFYLFFVNATVSIKLSPGRMSKYRNEKQNQSGSCSKTSFWIPICSWISVSFLSRTVLIGHFFPFALSACFVFPVVTADKANTLKSSNTQGSRSICSLESLGDIQHLSEEGGIAEEKEKSWMDLTAPDSLAGGESMHCPCTQLFRIVYLVLLMFCLVSDDA